MKEIFKEKPKVAKPGLNVGILLDKPPIKGEVGIEIEVEGKKLPHQTALVAPWQYHNDGSLRGEENGEYVFSKPLPFDKVPEALDKLWKCFKAKGTTFDDSNRTSVHVHLNCQDFYLNRLTAFLAIWFALEEPLTDWCGEHRVGNLFCLRAIDAPGIVSWAKRFIRSDGAVRIPDTMHYAGLNTNALKKFGSLEIRTLRGTSDPEVIKQWVKILQRLYEISADFNDPREVCTFISSGGGPLVFFDTMLGEMASVVRNAISYSDQELRESIYTGIRLAQDICYCREWDMYKPMPLKTDPFDRTMKTVAKKMMGMAGMNSETMAAEGIYFEGGPNGAVPVSVEEDSDEEDYYEPEPEYDLDMEPPFGE